MNQLSKLVLSLPIFFLMACGGPKQPARPQVAQDLSLGWFFDVSDTLKQMAVNLPGHGLRALHQNGKIGNPQFKQLDLAWLSGREWVFTKTLKLDSAAADKPRHTLSIGLAQPAALFVNGNFVDSLAGMGGRENVDLSEVLKPGKNSLKLVFSDPGFALPYHRGTSFSPPYPGPMVLAAPKLLSWQGIAYEGMALMGEQRSLGLNLVSEGEQTVRVKAMAISFPDTLWDLDTTLQLAAGNQLVALPFSDSLMPWQSREGLYQASYEWHVSLFQDSLPIAKDYQVAGFSHYGFEDGQWVSPSGKRLPIKACLWNNARMDLNEADEEIFFNRLYVLREYGYNTLIVRGNTLFESPYFFDYANRFGFHVVQELPASAQNWTPRQKANYKAYLLAKRNYPSFRGLTGTKLYEDLPYYEIETQVRDLPPYLALDQASYFSEAEQSFSPAEYFFEPEDSLFVMRSLNPSVSFFENAYQSQMQAAKALAVDAKGLPLACLPWPAIAGALCSFDGQPSAVLRQLGRMEGPYYAKALKKAGQVDVVLYRNQATQGEQHTVKVSKVRTNKSFSPEVLSENPVLQTAKKSKLYSFTLTRGIDTLSTALLVEVTDAFGNKVHRQLLYLCPWDHVKLVADPPLLVEVDHVSMKASLRISSSVLVQGVYLSHVGASHYYTHNFFDLLPGEEVELPFFMKDEYGILELKENLRIYYRNPKKS